MADKTAADMMVDLLVDKWGVRHIFGLPGDGINGIMEALRKRRVMFSSSSRATKRPPRSPPSAMPSSAASSASASPRPGRAAIHLMNGLFDAKFDQVPVLAITGMQYHDLIGTFYQQDVDTVRLMDNAAVYSERIMGAAHVENVTNLAVRMALGRRGVAHIGFPNDFQEQTAAQDKVSPMDQPHHTSADWRVPRVVPAPDDLQRAAEVLNAGKKVAIVVGAGARGRAGRGGSAGRDVGRARRQGVSGQGRADRRQPVHDRRHGRLRHVGDAGRLSKLRHAPDGRQFLPLYRLPAQAGRGARRPD